MKGGIITFHNVPNYGAALQAYALCVYLREKGVDCEIIDYKCPNLIKRELVINQGTNILKKIMYYLLIGNKKKKRIEGFKCAMDATGLVSKEEYLPDNMDKLNKKYDTFIVGSDQVWNLDITGYDYNYFLKFVSDEKKKFSFASSIGSNIWSKDECKNIKKLLERFTLVSTREEDSQIILKEMGINAKWIEDPTFLLPRQAWEKLAVLPKEKDYVLVYYPNDVILMYAKEYAKIYNKKVLVISDGMPKKGITKINPLTPFEWLGYIKNAFAVFTNSYHGLLFSIYMHKPVWINNKSNRQKAIIKKLQLFECNIEEKKVTELKKLNYDEVDKRKEKLCQESYIFVNEIIDNMRR